jgi:hypothetical protein
MLAEGVARTKQVAYELMRAPEATDQGACLGDPAEASLDSRTQAVILLSRIG